MTADFTVIPGGPFPTTLYLLTPHTDAAKEWVDEYLPTDAPCLGPAIAVEHRYIEDIVAGIAAAGLTVA